MTAQPHFEEPILYSTGRTPVTGDLKADLNGDGKMDLAVLCPTHVQVYLSGGDGSFTLASEVAIGSAANGLAAGDFNGDGKPDLAVSHMQGSGGNGEVTILSGDGAGGMAVLGTFATGLSPLSITAADFNQDGKVDLFVGGSPDSRVFMGNGNGTFASGTLYTVGSPIRPTAALLNSDLYPDLIFTTLAEGIRVMLNQGNGTLNAPVTLVGENSSLVPFDVCDLNHDNRPDIVASKYSAGTLHTFLGSAAGTFTALTPVAVTSTISDLRCNDADQDGEMDIVAASSFLQEYLFLKGHGDGTFDAAVPIRLEFAPGDIQAADWNGDTRLDVTDITSGGALRVYLQSVKNATSVNLTGTASPTTFAQTVQLTATVTAGGTPSGTVRFRNGGQLIGDVAVSGGQAGITLNSLPIGINFVTAAYLGNGTEGYSVSNRKLQQVVDLQLQLLRPVRPARGGAGGGSAAFRMTIATGIPNAAVTIRCAAPTGSVCTGPQRITADANGNGTAEFEVRRRANRLRLGAEAGEVRVTVRVGSGEVTRTILLN